MATSAFPTKQYTSEQFVESCGAVLLDFTPPSSRVCLIQYLETNEWLLPKGRRNIGESRREAALREVKEETGYECRIYPVAMLTRAPRSEDAENVFDEVRICPGIEEPFMLTVRELGEEDGVKVIWWFVACVEMNTGDLTRGVQGSADFGAEFFEYEEALQKLEFQTDRDVLARAIEMVEGSSIV
ncbi:putative NUDIX domain [Aspergillus stella-maris]|uniref:putative NUDIX domain n=1 Tax=Aspergillus stella-maris TaxID=1810926 RepID=UPI003CCCEE4D